MKKGKTRELAQLIKPYGLEIVDGRKHLKIKNENGATVYSFAGSPSCPFYAENTVAALIRQGLLPRELRLKKLR